MARLVPTETDFTSPEPRDGSLTSREADWSGLRVLVVGLGLSGFAAADALLEQRAVVTVVEGRTPEPETDLGERARLLDILGAELVTGPEASDWFATDEGAVEACGERLAAAGTEVVVTSPGLRPSTPLLEAARRADLPVWSEVELAWRMRPAEGAAPWLCVTGTNGKTTVVRMLTAMLEANGERAVAAGNVGKPIMEAMLDPTPFGAIAVELSSFQLHHTWTVSPQASAVLNIAADHVDWHGSIEEYAGDKGRIHHNAQVAAVYNLADEVTRTLVEQADVVEGCRAVGFGLGTPAPSELGLVEDVLADRAFVADRQNAAAEVATVADLTRGGVPPAPHLVANALAAAALARAHGVSPAAVRAGLRSFRADPHRMEAVLVAEGVTWVDDSKATNPHAAAAALTASDRIVWVAGGDLKGAEVDELVADVADRLAAVVLLGRDAGVIAEAVARHAPEVPVDRIEHTDPAQAMTDAVGAARARARSGDLVLLSPAAASIDMFRDYGERGDLFAQEVRRLHGEDTIGGAASDQDPRTGPDAPDA
ncbi:UDP-N-acetylmuramoyl-L-alanine--D-glutamate ligase [Kytococcus sp. Marseille-QA3725]